ncbi:MAG: VCBS repeat-containing protein, partial [Oscillospiraceae bacterium]|nr:VCBS repeat-containing protein [Oscillospiraceae bacterium]
MKKKRLLLLFAALLPLLLGGCMLSASAEELYALPQLPEEYQALRACISEVLETGAEYAAPQAGGNLPPVQMVDLNGDGSDEALAFFRVSSEERPLRIYIFQAVEDGYRQAAVIEGSGTSIHSIRYEDMDGDGVREILVS